MKAVVAHQYGDVEQLKYEDAPAPKPGPGEILVRVAASSVNPIDWKLLSGEMRPYMQLSFPAILGRDISGTVKQVGEGVKKFREGDRVMFFGDRGWAEFAVSKAEDAARIPQQMDMVEAAAIPLVTSTGTQLMEIAVVPERGEKILVTGAIGMVGRSAVYAAKRAGARVIAGVRHQELTDAKALAVDDIVALDDPAKLAKLAPFDGIADTVGPAVTGSLLQYVKSGGRLATVLSLPPNVADFPQVTTSMFQVHPDGARLYEIALDVASKRLVIPIGRRLPLAQAHIGVTAARNGGVGKILLLP